MYDLCCRVPNLIYFDSHAVLKKAKLRQVLFPKEKDSRYGNGIHVVLDARKVVVRELAGQLRSLARAGTPTSRAFTG